MRQNAIEVAGLRNGNAVTILPPNAGTNGTSGLPDQPAEVLPKGKWLGFLDFDQPDNKSVNSTSDALKFPRKWNQAGRQ